MNTLLRFIFTSLVVINSLPMSPVHAAPKRAFDIDFCAEMEGWLWIKQHLGLNPSTQVFPEELLTSRQNWEAFAGQINKSVTPLALQKSQTIWNLLINTYITEVVPRDRFEIRGKTGRFVRLLVHANLDGETKLQLWDRFAREVHDAMGAAYKKLNEARMSGKSTTTDPIEDKRLLGGFVSIGYKLENGMQIRIGHHREALVFASNGDLYGGQMRTGGQDLNQLLENNQAMPQPDMQKFQLLQP